MVRKPFSQVAKYDVEKHWNTSSTLRRGRNKRKMREKVLLNSKTT